MIHDIGDSRVECENFNRPPFFLSDLSSRYKEYEVRSRKMAGNTLKSHRKENIA